MAQRLYDLSALLYLALIVTLLPCYAPTGHAMLATAKITLYSNCAKIILPLLGLFLFTSLVCFFLENKTPAGKRRFLAKAFSPTDAFVLLYLLSILLSYLFSPYQETALWGTNGWYMGFLMHLCFLGMYFLLSRSANLKLPLLLLLFPTTTLLYLLALCNRFGYYPLDMQLQNAQFISLTGNINWTCGYMVLWIFFAVYLFFAGEKTSLLCRALLFAYLILAFLALLFQGSSSGTFCLLVLFFLLLLFALKNPKRLCAFFSLGLCLAAACLLGFLLRLCLPDALTLTEPSIDLFTKTPWVGVILSIVFLPLRLLSQRRPPEKLSPKVLKIAFVSLLLLALMGSLSFFILLLCNTLQPGSIGFLSQYEIFTFDASWGSSRGATWTCGWLCFLEQTPLHKLFGVGPDCMSKALYNGSASLQNAVEASFGTSRLTNAHNECLTLLVNCGILGLLSFLCMMGSAIVRFLQPQKGRQNTLAGACGLALLAYFVHNQVSFETILNVPTMYLLLGLGEGFLRKKKP